MLPSVRHTIYRKSGSVDAGETWTYTITPHESWEDGDLIVASFMHVHRSVQVTDLDSSLEPGAGFTLRAGGSEFFGFGMRVYTRTYQESDEPYVFVGTGTTTVNTFYLGIWALDASPSIGESSAKLTDGATASLVVPESPSIWSSLVVGACGRVGTGNFSVGETVTVTGGDEEGINSSLPSEGGKSTPLRLVSAAPGSTVSASSSRERHGIVVLPLDSAA